MEEILTPDQVVAAIDAGTRDDVQRLAGQLLAPEKLSLAVLGPYEDEAAFRPPLTF